MRVVINPGHDGLRDRGAHGLGGLNESEVVQDVAAMMRDLGGYECKRQGILGLWTLTRALKKNPPDVLVSLHANAGTSKRHEAHFYYNDGDEDGSRRHASFGLASTFTANCSFAEEAKVYSAPYAREGRSKPYTPGILRDTATRAVVLVELGFISDPHVEAEMATAEWRVRAANDLHNTLQAWAKRLLC